MNAIILKSGKIVECVGSHLDTLKNVLGMQSYVDDEQEVQLMAENSILYYRSNRHEISLQLYSLDKSQYFSIMQLAKDDLENQTYFILNNNCYDTFQQLNALLKSYAANGTNVSIFKECSDVVFVSSLSKPYEYSNMQSIANVDLSIDTIYERAFVNCVNLKSLNLHCTQTICKEAFNSCEKLAYVSLPDTLSAISSDAFANCTSLQSIDLPESLMHIGNTAFKNCNSLSSLVLPTNLKTIGYAAFENCSSLVSVSMPTTLELISENAFNNCTNLSCVAFY